MEKFSATTSSDQTELELPPGFRFHPTDEELITHYLYPKVMDYSFSTIAIGEVDLNKVEPWELPWRAKMGEKEWYFYSKRDRKYPKGSRTNRASKAGYWKTTGKDKDIFKKKTLSGMKKTLVFYKGRAPNGEKTNWVMHEYRLVGNLFESIQSYYAEKNEWVICRIFKKSSGGKKVDISSMKNNQKDDISVASSLPTLIDLSSDDENPKQIMAVDSPNVSCFSGFLMDKNPLDDNLIIPDFPNSSSMASGFSQNLMVYSQSVPSYIENLQYADLSFMQEQSVHGLLLLDAQGNGRQNGNMGFSWENDMYNYPHLHNNHANVNFNCMWN